MLWASRISSGAAREGHAGPHSVAYESGSAALRNGSPKTRSTAARSAFDSSSTTRYRRCKFSPRSTRKRAAQILLGPTKLPHCRALCDSLTPNFCVPCDPPARQFGAEASSYIGRHKQRRVLGEGIALRRLCLFLDESCFLAKTSGWPTVRESTNPVDLPHLRLPIGVRLCESVSPTVRWVSGVESTTRDLRKDLSQDGRLL